MIEPVNISHLAPPSAFAGASRRLPGARLAQPFLTLPQRLATRRWRPAVYALLATVIISGAVLSLVMEATTARIRENSAPLFQRQVPLLSELGQVKTALQHYQSRLVETEYAPGSAEHFLEIDQSIGEVLRERLEHLQSAMGADETKTRVQELGRRLATSASAYARLAGRRDLDAHIALTHLWDDLSALSICIDVLEQQTRGAIAASSRNTEDDVVMITRTVHLFNVLALLTAVFMMYHIRVRFRSEDELAHQAGHDPLTGLPDRRTFELRLQKLPPWPHTVVLGTIDRFSAVVGGYGHAVGDRMIQSMVARIGAIAQAHGGTVFRLDGANIAVLYPHAQGGPALRSATDALLRSVRTPFSCDGQELYSSLSLGSAAFPEDGSTPLALLRNADAALRQARSQGGDQILAYSRELNERTEHRLRLEAALRHAVERKELEVYFQPQQSLRDGTLIGFEALLRWRHEGVQISPAEFIPLAEQTGQIVAIGHWVLRRSCEQAALWQRQGGRPLIVAINISPRQFADTAFVDSVRQILWDTGVAPSAIELEITEGVMVDGGERAVDILRSLRALGLRLSVDDFGTGYSSLAYLKRFPIHKLKVDQSFIRQLGRNSEDAPIVQAVIALGHQLGLSVIAEGVETEEQRSLLQAWNCDEIQGYWYGRPMDAASASFFAMQSGEHAN